MRRAVGVGPARRSKRFDEGGAAPRMRVATSRTARRADASFHEAGAAPRMCMLYAAPQTEPARASMRPGRARPGNRREIHGRRDPARLAPARRAGRRRPLSRLDDPLGARRTGRARAGSDRTNGLNDGIRHGCSRPKLDTRENDNAQRAKEPGFKGEKRPCRRTRWHFRPASGGHRDGVPAVRRGVRRHSGPGRGRRPAGRTMPLASGNSPANCGCTASMRASRAATASVPETTEKRMR